MLILVNNLVWNVVAVLQCYIYTVCSILFLFVGVCDWVTEFYWCSLWAYLLCWVCWSCVQPSVIVLCLALLCFMFVACFYLCYVCPIFAFTMFAFVFAACVWLNVCSSARQGFLMFGCYIFCCNCEITIVIVSCIIDWVVHC